jgi:malonyl-CoA O-methyltransferase
MNALDLDKLAVKRSFSAAAAAYDASAQLQREVGLTLLRRFPPKSRNGGVLVDIGCGTGFLTHQLAAVSAAQLIAFDIALPMLQTCRARYPNIPVHYINSDAESLPFRSGSVEQVYSNLALQWAQDLPATMLEMARVLKPSGELVFATFGPETLKELKAAWAQVDDFTHVNEFHSACEIGVFLRDAGFKDMCIDSELYRYDYASVEALMRELKGLGAHNVNRNRNHQPTTRTQLQRMIEHYHEQMPQGELYASYEIIFVGAVMAP